MARARGQQASRVSPRARGHYAWAAGILGIVGAAAVAFLAYRPAATPPGTLIPTQGNQHIATESTQHIPYATDPPTSGPHLPYLAPWGVHTTPIARELQVHNLEDGGVLVQYTCECPDLVAKLRAIVQRYDRQVILAPYPGMKGRIVLTAWQRIDQFDEFDEARIVRFVGAYRGIDHHP